MGLHLSFVFGRYTDSVYNELNEQFKSKNSEANDADNIVKKLGRCQNVHNAPDAATDD